MPVWDDVKVTIHFAKKYTTSIHLPNFFTELTQGILMPLLPIMCREAGYNDAITGSIISASGLGRLISGVPGAMAVHRWGPLAAMIGSMGLYALGTLLHLVFWHLWSLYIAFVVFGFSIALFQMSRHQVLAALVTKEERGRLMSLVGGVQRWSGVIGSLVAGLVLSFASARWCFFAQIPLVGLAVASIACSGTIRQVSTAVAEQQQALSPSLASIAGALWAHKGRVLSIGFFAASLNAMRGGRRLMLPLIALNFHLDPAVVGVVVSLSFLVDSCLFWTGGVVMDRFGRRAAAVPTAVLMALSYFSLGMASTIPVFFVCVVLFGASDALGSGLLLTIIADSAPSEAGASFYGLMRVIQASGQLFGPILMGSLMHFYSVGLTCVVFGILGLTSGAVALFAPYFGRAPGDKVSYRRATHNAFAALPDNDDAESVAGAAGEDMGDVARRPPRIDSSVDLDIDGDDMALFNAAHPAVAAAPSVRVASDADAL